MFNHIRGKLTDKGNDYVVIDVNGIGFKIFTSLNSINEAGRLGMSDDVTFYTHLYIKEGIMDLYGFSTKEELAMFTMLISVSGVGAKGAIAILSVNTPSKIAVSIVTGDVKAITKAQGIGPKIAQRVVLELKDKVGNDFLTSGVEIEEVDVFNDDSNAKSEAISALVVLGYSANEAKKAVSKVDASINDVEEIIKASLKNLM